jgi:glycine cleavage system H lipoate-binding protein
MEWESTILNDDPYGEGWIAKVEMDGEPQELLKAGNPEFASFIAAEREKYGK